MQSYAFSIVLLALFSVVSAISQAEFDALRDLASVGYSYAQSPQGQIGAPPCALSSVNDSSGNTWFVDASVDIADAAGGTITVRLARRDDLQEYYVFFPPTTDIRNWATNLQVQLVDYPLCNDCQVHEGFYDAWIGGRDSVIDMVRRARDDNSTRANYNIVTAGGSLGGALAVLAYADFKSSRPFGIDPSRGISFGQPRVGNYNFAQFVNGFLGADPNNNGNWQRVTHGLDTIPRILPLGPYQNQGTEIHMVDAGFTQRPTADSTTVLSNVSPNNENPNGVNTFNPLFPLGNLADHLTYPGYVAESVPCVPPGSRVRPRSRIEAGSRVVS